MKNRIIKIIILSIFMILFYYLVLNDKFLDCILLKTFGIACPGCGLTRAFRYIVHFHFIKAFKMNILSIPLFILFIVLFVLIIIDIIKNKYYVEKLILYLCNKFGIVIVILLVISMIVNNFNPLIVD